MTDITVGSTRLADVPVSAAHEGEQRTVTCAVTVSQEGQFRLIPEGRMTAVEGSSVLECRRLIQEKIRAAMTRAAERETADFTGIGGWVVAWSKVHKSFSVVPVEAIGVRSPTEEGSNYHRPLRWKNPETNVEITRPEREPTVFVTREDAERYKRLREAQELLKTQMANALDRGFTAGLVGLGYGCMGKTNAKAAAELRKRYDATVKKFGAAQMPQEGK